MTLLPLVAALMAVSAFFSGSEAAYFSLTQTQRRRLARGRAATDRIANGLLNDSERLLMGILFWNLLINIFYFSLVTRIGLAWEKESGSEGSGFAIVAASGLIAIILFGEFLPKSFAILYPMAVVKGVAFPLAFAIRVTSLVAPLMQFVTEASRRLLIPGLQPEPYLGTQELNRVVELSSHTDALLETEGQVLRNIIQLKEISVEEWMRPRTQFSTFKPPLAWEILERQSLSTGYVLVSNRTGDQIVSYLDLSTLTPRDFQQLDRKLEPVLIVPWCVSLADALQRQYSENRRVSVVVNEYGDAIGIITWEDIFDAVLQLQKGRSLKELARAEIRKMAEDRWLATGLTKIRRLERALGRKFEKAESATVGGVLQNHLHRLPDPGDCCVVSGMKLKVLEAGSRGELLVEVTLESTDGVGD